MIVTHELYINVNTGTSTANIPDMLQRDKNSHCLKIHLRRGAITGNTERALHSEQYVERYRDKDFFNITGYVPKISFVNDKGELVVSDVVSVDNAYRGDLSYVIGPALLEDFGRYTVSLDLEIPVDPGSEETEYESQLCFQFNIVVVKNFYDPERDKDIEVTISKKEKEYWKESIDHVNEVVDELESKTTKITYKDHNSGDVHTAEVYSNRAGNPDILVPDKLSQLENDMKLSDFDNDLSLSNFDNDLTLSDFDNTETDYQSGEEVQAAIEENVVDNVESTATNKSLSANMGKELNDRIDDLSGKGRYLSGWDCSTGTATSNPLTSPYEYHAGDYFIIAEVASEGGTNYRPSGSQYVIGEPSIVVETEDVAPNDTYWYDGTNWLLQINSAPKIAIDDELSPTSENPVQNKVITNYLADNYRIDLKGATKTISIDSVNGDDSNDGSSWSKSVKTMTRVAEIINQYCNGYITVELLNEVVLSNYITISYNTVKFTGHLVSFIIKNNARILIRDSNVSFVDLVAVDLQHPLYGFMLEGVSSLTFDGVAIYDDNDSATVYDPFVNIDGDNSSVSFIDFQGRHTITTTRPSFIIASGNAKVYFGKGLIPECSGTLLNCWTGFSGEQNSNVFIDATILCDMSNIAKLTDTPDSVFVNRRIDLLGKTLDVYVDGDNGSNSNDGLSANTALETLDALNQFTDNKYYNGTIYVHASNATALGSDKTFLVDNTDLIYDGVLYSIAGQISIKDSRVVFTSSNTNTTTNHQFISETPFIIEDSEVVFDQPSNTGAYYYDYYGDEPNFDNTKPFILTKGNSNITFSRSDLDTLQMFNLSLTPRLAFIEVQGNLEITLVGNPLFNGNTSTTYFVSCDSEYAGNVILNNYSSSLQFKGITDTPDSVIVYPVRVPKDTTWEVKSYMNGTFISGPTFSTMSTAINNAISGDTFHINLLYRNPPDTSTLYTAVLEYDSLRSISTSLAFTGIDSANVFVIASVTNQNNWTITPAFTGYGALTAKNAGAYIGGSVGSATQPIYLDVNGVPTGCNDSAVTVSYKGNVINTFPTTKSSDVEIDLPSTTSETITLLDTDWVQQTDGTYQQEVEVADVTGEWNPATYDLIFSPVLPNTKANRDILYQSMISCISGTYDSTDQVTTFVFTCDADIAPTIDIDFTITRMV